MVRAITLPKFRGRRASCMPATMMKKQLMGMSVKKEKHHFSLIALDEILYSPCGKGAQQSCRGNVG